MLKRILDALAIPYPIADREVRVTASIGATVFPIDAVDPDQLLRHADHAMYNRQARRQEPFQPLRPDPGIPPAPTSASSGKIEDALAHSQFTSTTSPRWTAGRAVRSASGAPRWQHPVLGLRMPGEFLPLIEHEDVIVSIGNRVIAGRCASRTRLRAAGHDLSISVNIAARQLLRDASPTSSTRSWPSTPRPTRAPGSRSRTAALEDVAAVGQLIADFQGRGVRFALDDFGTAIPPWPT